MMKKNLVASCVYVFAVLTVSSLGACGAEPCDTAECPEHAVCEAGSCVCESGYAGDDCAPVEQEVVLSDFEDLSLDDESFYNGSDLAGGFSSGELYFGNNFNTDYQSWDGFSYSNVTDTTTAGWENQYGVIAGGGQNNSENFGVGYVATYPGATPTTLHLSNDQRAVISGAYFCNTTQDYLSMLQGDSYAKKFGGDDGTDPDWFKLSVFGLDANGQRSGPVDFYLADFRSDTADEDYIIDDWTWVDLSSLGEVRGLTFEMSSSDAGEYGMNTPAYFALDMVMGQHVSAD